MSNDESPARLLARYKSAIAQDPNNPQIRVAIAQLLADMGHSHDAAQHFLGAARLFDRQRLLREAAENCARVLTLDPGNEGAVALLRQLGDDDPRPARRVSEGPVVVHPGMTPGEMNVEEPDVKTLPPPSAEQDRGDLGHHSAPAFENSSSGSKRFRLRSKRPRRRVSPLDRTVLDVDSLPGGGSASASDEQPSLRRASSPELSSPEHASGVGRIEGTLPLRRRRKTVSPLDRTEIERNSGPPKRTEGEVAGEPRGRLVATRASDVRVQGDDAYSTRIERRSRSGDGWRQSSRLDQELTAVEVRRASREVRGHKPGRGEATHPQEAVVDQGQIRPGFKMKCTLSCDHRVIDGSVGARFLKVLKSMLQDPATILV